ncbi:MAG: glycoside hydrolase family 32 protein [Ferruginibacter sp.]
MKKYTTPFICFLFLLLFSIESPSAQPLKKLMHEQHRPQIHFSPQKNWMNDPNGMVYHNGVYHLFFQYYPGKPVWGPMHWGHATSKDLLHWKEQAIGLYPDSLGYIFSGSAVVDKDNTSGFGINGKTPLVAVFTHHNMDGEKAKRNDFQFQSIAYSNDDGNTWTKYAGNPVLKNPGIVDFRDPKVMWYGPAKKWIMTLATKDCVTFYSSPDLKNWSKESEFGKNIGAHGGVWECPDLLPLNDNGKEVWVLLASINPGAPNKGSATQYFLGDFNGHEFLPFDTITRWVDYGTDNYAGITWSNTGKRKIFLGWMSNWLYATSVPTTAWRSAMTIPRELKIKHSGNNLLLASTPVKELSLIQSEPAVINNVPAGKKMKILNLPCRIDLELNELKDLSITLSNSLNEETIIGYDEKKSQFFIDRSRSGNTNFQEDFAGRQTAPRFSVKKNTSITLVIDVSSVELFADDGLTVMTAIFFPAETYHQIQIESSAPVKKMSSFKLDSIWK